MLDMFREVIKGEERKKHLVDGWMNDVALHHSAGRNVAGTYLHPALETSCNDTHTHTYTSDQIMSVSLKTQTE